MPAKVTANMGNVFEGGSDLTMLPCSAKPTWTKGVDKWIELYGIPSPRDLAESLSLSQVTRVAEFTGPQHVTRFIAYGASVFNDHRPHNQRTVGNPEC